MTSALETKFRYSALALALALGLLTLAGGVGCAGNPDDEVASREGALARGGGGVSSHFSCTEGLCTCDKSIENDCEDMSGVCSDATVGPLIDCINGWLTTDCTCKLAGYRTAPKTNLPVLGGAVKAKLSVAP